MGIHADHRSIDSEARPEVHGRLLRRWRVWLRGELALAEDFAEILSSKHFAEEECASLAEYARKLGYDGSRAWRLARLGLAIRVEPGIRDDLQGRRTSFENALQLADAILDERLRNARDWRAEAATHDERGLKRVIRKARESRALGSNDLRRIEILTPEVGRDNWRRLKYLVQAKVGRELTDGQLFLWLTEYVLEQLDPVRKARHFESRKPRARSPGGEPSAGTCGFGGSERGSRANRDGRTETGSPRQEPQRKQRSRRIPAELLRELLIRSGGRCEVPGCRREGQLEVMHLVPFCDGAPDDLRALAFGCHRHHVIFDAGRLKLIGFSADGRPMFEDRRGRLLAPRAPPPRRPPGPDPP